VYEGYGGAIAVYSVAGLAGIMFGGEGLSFSECNARNGKHIFIELNDFDSAYNKITFNYDYDLSNINNIVGSNSQAQMIPLYNYLTQLTQEEYIWMVDTCVDFAKCEDIRPTGNDGVIKIEYNIYICV
jgi:hypothetical protein